MRLIAKDRESLRYICFMCIIVFGFTSYVGCSGGGGSSEGGNITHEVQGEIGPQGGVLEVTDPESPIYGTTLEIPEGALDSSATLTITKNDTPAEPNENMVSVGTAVELSPDGTQFNIPIEVTLPYLDENNDGLLDGTNTPEEYIIPVVYNEELETWLCKKVVDQDLINNTVTFKTKHFTGFDTNALYRETNDAVRDVIATIDGLSFVKTLVLPSDLQRKSYLKRALLEGMLLDQDNIEVISYAGPKVDKIVETSPVFITTIDDQEEDSWSGDADTTADILEDLIEAISREYRYAKRGGRKFILMGHSWGTVLSELALMYATDKDGIAIEPDLMLTLSAPRGSDQVFYDEDHEFIEIAPSPLQEKLFPKLTFLVSILEDIWTVDEIETKIADFSLTRINECVTQKERLDGIFPNPIRFRKAINYYTPNDIISGPLQNIIGSPIDNVAWEDRQVDISDLEERRNAANMINYHAVTSLDEEGYWNDWLEDNPDIKEQVAIPLRKKVKCDVLTALGEDCDAPEGTVISAGGRIWMDRNLGASRVATSSTDSEAYGDLYQWGRGTDGHQLRTSATTTTISSIDVPGHGNFILYKLYPNVHTGDWRSPSNDDLWQGVSGVNNPCPVGFRVPTQSEWEEEIASWDSKDSAGAYGSPLKIVSEGHRAGKSGTIYDNGYNYMWSSTTIDGFAPYGVALRFTNDEAGMDVEDRADGHCVRCIMD